MRATLVKPLNTLLAELGHGHDVFLGADSTAEVEGVRKTCPGVPTSASDVERQAMRSRSTNDSTIVASMPVNQPSFMCHD